MEERQSIQPRNSSSREKTTHRCNFLWIIMELSLPLCDFFLLEFSRKSWCLLWFDLSNFFVNPPHFGTWINSLGITHCKSKGIKKHQNYRMIDQKENIIGSALSNNSVSWFCTSTVFLLADIEEGSICFHNMSYNVSYKAICINPYWQRAFLEAWPLPQQKERPHTWAREAKLSNTVQKALI